MTACSCLLAAAIWLWVPQDLGPWSLVNWVWQAASLMTTFFREILIYWIMFSMLFYLIYTIWNVLSD